MQKTLYVSNIEKTADLYDLENLFTTVGDVTAHHAQVIPESGLRGSFGVFEMSTAQQAADCVERFNGHNLNGKRLAIVSERPKLQPFTKKKVVSRRGN